MNYADFDPYLIREPNKGLRRDAWSLRLEKRPRADRPGHGPRFLTFAWAATKSLVHVTRLPGRRQNRVFPGRSAVGTTSVGGVYTTR